MRPPQQTSSSSRWNLWVVLGILGGIGLSVFAVQEFFKQQQFQRGLDAYQQGNCDQTIAQLQPFAVNTMDSDSGDRAARAKAMQTECQLFQDGERQQQAKQPDAALLTYIQFATRYPNSPLISSIKQQTGALFQQPGAVALAKLNTCKQMDALTKQSLVPQPETNLPPFYQTCGQVFADNKNYTAAIAVNEKFLDLYPKHALAGKVKNAYAQALYADAQAKGAGTIAPPGFNGTTGDGSTVVEIRNDSPEQMRIVFGGPSPRVEELPPCKDCQVFQNEKPTGCPQKGPIGRYVVEPGDYRVVVKALGSRRVNPFTGNWTLDGNTQYSHCFYLVQSLF